MRRVGVERLAELVAELGRRAVFVWFPGRGLGSRRVVEFGELDEILISFAIGGVLERLLY